jgi:ABC-type phosphate/phosphonate transport system permease subunit
LICFQRSSAAKEKWLRYSTRTIFHVCRILPRAIILKAR